MLDMTKVPANWQRDEFMGLYSAMQRAAHLMLDHDPRIFEDPLALRIMGPEAESRVRLNLAHLRSLFGRSLRASMMARNRYTEDELVRFILRGVRQYIILGAGLDTFAYRNSFEDLRVFEVDYPDTQAWKRSCLEKAAIPIPASVTYVAVDFGRQMITDALRRSGFRSDEPAFFSFIGVTRYLTREALISVFSSIVSSMPTGSEIVVDFYAPPSLLQRLREPNQETNGFRPSYFDPMTITRDLKPLGFADVKLIGPKELNVRYCKNRKDGLRIRNRMHLIQACV
jgi:methyltransferase (TIGR00027 family)